MRYLIVIWMIAEIVEIGYSKDPNDPIGRADNENIRAARSVHLFYSVPEATLFYNEVAVEKSQKGSYFMVCGFSHGYFGIQERTHDKVVIFSVWDPGMRDDPEAVQQEQRVRVLYKDENVHIGRFGGEGTGGQSFLEYNWSTSETYKFLISAAISGNRTEYAAYFYMNEQQRWRHLVTFSTITDGDLLQGCYSFIEDFRRDVKSVQEMRKARFENGWVKTAKGQWISLTRAKFTGDSTPLMNINAGISDGGFFLQTGGQTQNHIPLESMMERLPSELFLPEAFLPKMQ